MKRLFAFLILPFFAFPTLAATPKAKPPAKKPAPEMKKSEGLISMVIEPDGQSLKVHLSTSENTKKVDLKSATVAATAEEKGQTKTLEVSKQKDQKSHKEYFLIKGIQPTAKNLKIAVKAGNITENFTIPSL